MIKDNRATRDNKQSYMANLVDQSNEGSTDIVKYARTVVYGEFGAGKTHFCNTYPNVLFFDCDHGMTTTVDKATKETPPAIRFARGDSIYRPTMQMIHDMNTQSGPFNTTDGEFKDIKSIAIDGLTSLAGDIMDEIVIGVVKNQRVDKSEFKPSYDEWGMLKSRMESILEGLKTIPYHLCLTAMAKLDKDEATGSYVGMFDIIGSTRDIVGRMFNEIYFVEKRKAKGDEREKYGREVVHEFYTQYHPRFKVKSRLGDNHKIPARAVNPTFDSLYGHIYRGAK